MLQSGKHYKFRQHKSSKCHVIAGYYAANKEFQRTKDTEKQHNRIILSDKLTKSIGVSDICQSSQENKGTFSCHSRHFKQREFIMKWFTGSGRAEKQSLCWIWQRWVTATALHFQGRKRWRHQGRNWAFGGLRTTRDVAILKIPSQSRGELKLCFESFSLPNL